MPTLNGQGNTQYGINTINSIPAEWQDSPYFDELDDMATYYFFAKYLGNDNYNSAISEALILDLSGYCFIAGTKISMTNGTTKNIEDILVGDKVFAYDVTNSKVFETVVLSTYEHISKTIAIITLNNGVVIKCTPSHPLLTAEGFKSVDSKYNDVMKEYPSTDLVVGDTVITELGNAIVKTIEIKEEVVSVYNFHVKSNNGDFKNCTYFANGVVVHNAGGC